MEISQWYDRQSAMNTLISCLHTPISSEAHIRKGFRIMYRIYHTSNLLPHQWIHSLSLCTFWWNKILIFGLHTSSLRDNLWIIHLWSFYSLKIVLCGCSFHGFMNNMSLSSEKWINVAFWSLIYTFHNDNHQLFQVW